jgi:hypothetical protein
MSGMEFMKTITDAFVNNIKKGKYESGVSVLFPTEMAEVLLNYENEVIKSISQEVSGMMNERLTKEELKTLGDDYAITMNYMGGFSNEPLALLMKIVPNKNLSSLRKQTRQSGGQFIEYCCGCNKGFTKTYKCGGCKTARYCGAECAKTAWKTHKKSCKKTA